MPLFQVPMEALPIRDDVPKRGARGLGFRAWLLTLLLLWSAGAMAQDADLAITKSDGSASYAPGGTVVYQIVVSNAGPDDAFDAVVEDPLPAGTSLGAWTCTPSGAASCGQGVGAGGISTTVDLPAGGQVVFAHTVSIPPGFTGPLVNTATVGPPSGITDPVPSNNSATDTNLPAADVSVSKSAAPAEVRTGEVVSFTLTVDNAGPAAADGAVLTDAPGVGMDCTTPSAIASCSASGGASCPASVPVSALIGAGIAIPTLPVGGQVVVTLQCTVTASGQ